MTCHVFHGSAEQSRSRKVEGVLEKSADSAIMFDRIRMDEYVRTRTIYSVSLVTLLDLYDQCVVYSGVTTPFDATPSLLFF